MLSSSWNWCSGTLNGMLYETASYPDEKIKKHTMSSSPRRDASQNGTSGESNEPVKRNFSHQNTDTHAEATSSPVEAKKSPKQTLRPRPSRWADEVDEDDQFIPTAPSAPKKSVSESTPTQQTRTRQPIPLRRQVSKEDGRFGRNSREQGYQAKGRPTFDGKGKKESSNIPRQRSPKQPSREDIEEIAHMKEIMAKKAEEKKRLKLEEEARVEAERRARCEAKLREMEEKQRVKISSGNSSLSSTPPFTAIIDPELEAKRNAFNQRRLEVRYKREGKTVVSSSSSPKMYPSSPDGDSAALSNTSPTRLSPHAAEFVPTSAPPPPPAYYHPMHHQPQQMAPGHWMPAGGPGGHPPYYGGHHHPQMWHHYQWPPHGVPPPYAGGPPPPHPGYPHHPFPQNPAPQQYDPRDI